MLERKRIQWIDWIKLFACVLVVLGHLHMSMMSVGYYEETMFFYCWPVQTVYTFHVPLFFVCSGFLYQNSKNPITKGEHLRVIKSKFLNLGIPYVVFSTITLLLKVLFSSEVNNPATPFFRTLLLDPIAPYWFLYALFFVFVIIPRFKNKKKLILVCIAAFVAKIVYILNPTLSGILPYAVRTVILNASWFLFGMLWSVLRRNRENQNKYIAGSGILAGILISLIVYRQPNESEVTKMIIGFIFVISIVELFWQNEKIFKTRLLEKLNEYFMPVFLIHTISAAAARTVLFKCGISSLGVHVLIGVFVSFLIPIVIYEIAKKHWLILFWIEPSKALKMRRNECQK